MREGGMGMKEEHGEGGNEGWGNRNEQGTWGRGENEGRRNGYEGGTGGGGGGGGLRGNRVGKGKRR